MGRVQPTNPIAAKREAEQLRLEGSALLARADQLDPPKEAKSTKAKSSKSNKRSLANNSISPLTWLDQRGRKTKEITCQ